MASTACSANETRDDLKKVWAGRRVPPTPQFTNPTLLPALLLEDDRLRTEAVTAQSIEEGQRPLLPLALALSRLIARRDVADLQGARHDQQAATMMVASNG